MLTLLVGLASLLGLCACANPMLAFEDEPPDALHAPQVASRQPQLSSVFPIGARPGERGRLELGGEFLDGATQVLFESEDVSGKVLSSSFTTARIEVSVSAEAVPGPRRFRLVTPRGASDSAVVRISRWETPVEVEPNDDLDLATTIRTPVLISGRLQTEEDVDLYRFRVEAGQRLQFNVLGARNGSQANVSLAILRTDGREIVHDEGRFIWDPYIDHTFEKDGDYLAAVTLTRMPAGGQSRNDLNYQLAIGQSPFFWSVFPLGARPGGSLEMRLRADFVDPGTALKFYKAGDYFIHKVVPGISGKILERSSGEVRVSLNIEPDVQAGVYEFSVADDSGTLAPLRFVVGSHPGLAEAEPNQEQNQAQPLTYPVTVNGRADPEADEDWFRVSVEAGSSLAFEVDAEKVGSIFDSFLALIDAKGETVASNDDAKWINRALNRDSQILFEFKESGDYWVRLSSLYRHGGPDHVYRLTVRPAKPDFMLSLNTDRPSVLRGGTGKISVTIGRMDGFKGDVSIGVRGLPNGVTAAPLTITPNQDSAQLELRAAAGAALTLSTIELFGTALIGGQEILHTAYLPPGRFQGSGPAFAEATPMTAYLAVVEPPDFSLEPAASTVYLVRGGTAEFGVKVARRADFTESLSLAAENLPAGVSIERVDLIDDGRMARITLKADAQASPARIPNVAIIGVAEKQGRKLTATAPRISLQLD